jgi:hypothetical protein
MLIASNRIVGAMNSQAMALSERPRTCGRRGADRRSPGRPDSADVARIHGSSTVLHGKSGLAAPIQGEGAALACVQGRSRLRLAVFLEDLGPVLHQAVERLLGRALVGDDVVVERASAPPAAAARRRAQPRNRRWPWSQEGGAKGGWTAKSGIVHHALVAGIAAELPPLLLHVELEANHLMYCSASAWLSE